MNAMKQHPTLVVIIALIAVLTPAVFAGSLNPPAGPNDTGSAMFSIEAIYQRLLNGTAGDKRGGTPGTFQDPAGAPGSTMHTLNDVMGVAPVKDPVDGASADQVLTGKKFWGLKDGAGWGLLGGTMPMAAITADSTQVKGGSIATTTLTAIDADLTSANIKAGTTIFGVTGDTNVVNTSTGNATAGEILFGRTVWVDGAAVTGTLAGGRVVVDPAWASSPLGIWRNTGNGILDTRTGLIWHSQGSWPLPSDRYEETVSQNVTNPWRLPTIAEYQTLLAGPETAAASMMFTSVLNAEHWSAQGRGSTLDIHTFNPVSGSAVFILNVSDNVPFWLVR